MADISSLVQESLSVSGILLGKTMGRGNELADRFERESARLADLEVRSRMAGRWVMASIQTSFAVMPALVYLFAGLTPGAVTIGTLVAFTTLQTRLFWPIQSLLNVGVDIQTSMALFERVFEYLDLPVDLREGRRSLPQVRVELRFAALAGAVGVVSQETYLFHASVRENLRFARPDATDEEIEAAARAAQIHDVIASLPDGYDTVVGERGFRLSGGEKQRVAIARMLLKDPCIVVLDEATSHLDSENEQLVQQALATALAN